MRVCQQMLHQHTDMSYQSQKRTLPIKHVQFKKKSPKRIVGTCLLVTNAAANPLCPHPSYLSSHPSLSSSLFPTFNPSYSVVICSVRSLCTPAICEMQVVHVQVGILMSVT
mmetsp:Transcript_97168/g.156757  ORF Transcript_97168/g.156757 Transcript_97168/m.156757 type:complete len:111 (+) Transcript_97168:1258-1590(+)